MIVELPSVHQPLTVDVAKSHAALPQIKGDRNLQSSRLSYLKDAHDRGLFHSPIWAVAYCKESGKHYRINGKHSANFLSGLNGHFPKGMSVTVLQFQCDTIAELASLFDQFDSPASTRTRGDSVNVHKSVHESLAAVSKTSALKAIAGIAWHIRNVVGKSLNQADQNQLVHHYSDFLQWQVDLTGTRRMNRAGVVAAMFQSWNIDAVIAKQFWVLVRDQSHEDAKNGSRSLGKFLEISVYNPVEQMTKLKWDSRAFYVKSVHGWNAWITNTTTDLKYHSNSPLPNMKAPK